MLRSSHEAQEITLLQDRELRNALFHIDRKISRHTNRKTACAWFIDSALDPMAGQQKELEVSCANATILKIRRYYTSEMN